jgi:hypothetical protein
VGWKTADEAIHGNSMILLLLLQALVFLLVQSCRVEMSPWPSAIPDVIKHEALHPY